jgi:30S ribosomal protein 3
MKLKLKVLWSKEFLGFALNQQEAQNTYSLTDYYFWPRTAAWEQLKLELNSKIWMVEEEKVRILNLVTDIMNYWQKNRQQGSIKTVELKFSEVLFINDQYFA